jgi:hypothetical protein
MRGRGERSDAGDKVHACRQSYPAAGGTGPHGREWNRDFAGLLDPFLSAELLPADVGPVRRSGL